MTPSIRNFQKMAPDSRNIKLIIAYDGTNFSGWQRQCKSLRDLPCDSLCESQDNLSHKVRTVQGVIEKALEKIHGHAVPLTGSGRTDAGVHAAGQAANFYTDINSIPAQKFVPALNTLLPQDVRILEACETDSEFHARFSALSRTYRYHFICGRPALPHESRFNLQLWRYPKIETLNAYGRLLIGETDCSIFAGAGDSALEPGKSTNRYIHSAHFFMETGRLIFEISANAFMRKMVRSIAGTFLHCEEKDTKPEILREIILTGERSLAGPTLPPEGLFLWKVEFAAL